MMGIIEKQYSLQNFLGKAKIYYFDTEHTPNLNYHEVKTKTLKKIELEVPQGAT